MRQLRTLVFVSALIAAAGPSVAQDSAAASYTLAITTAPITLRTRPLASATVVVQLPAGAVVRLYSCTGGWCRVVVQRQSGYALQEYLSHQAVQSAPGQSRGYVNSKGQWVPSPTRTPNNQPPTGATARCLDGTFSFSQSRRGTCSHHGGVAQWL